MQKTNNNNKPRFQFNKRLPPNIQTFPVHTVTARYSVGADVDDIAITSQDLFKAVGFVGTVVSSKEYKSIVQYIRLESIQIWAPQSTTSGIKPGECSVTVGSTVPSGVPTGVFALPARYRSVSASADKPAHVHFVPSRDTVPGMWYFSNANINNLFNIDCTSGGTIDLTVSFILNRSLGALPSGSPTNGRLTGSSTVPELGQVYMFAIGSANIVPDGEYANARRIVTGKQIGRAHV